MTDSLRTRIAAVAEAHEPCGLPGGIDCNCGQGFRPDSGSWVERAVEARQLWSQHLADAVIRELGPIPDHTHVDDQGRTWEWCGGQPGTWAWRITQNGPVDVDDVDVECAICHRTYSIRADAPGWSSVWTCCISCQANEGNGTEGDHNERFGKSGC